jgi:hypothetical protein
MAKKMMLDTVVTFRDLLEMGRGIKAMYDDIEKHYYNDYGLDMATIKQVLNRSKFTEDLHYVYKQFQLIEYKYEDRALAYENAIFSLEREIHYVFRDFCF